MTLDITILGAGSGPTRPRLDVSGRNAGRQGVLLAAGQVRNLYDAPVKTEWAGAAREVGGRMRGISYEVRDLVLGFHTFGDDTPRGQQWLDSMLRSCFTYEPDPWDPDDQLAQIIVDSGRDLRRLSVQLYDAIEFDPEQDPELDEYSNPQYMLRAGQPMWEGRTEVTSVQSSATSASGTIIVSNPTDRPMLQSWKLTRAAWTLPDVSWIGPKGKRVPGGEFGTRTIPLNRIDDVHGGARINLDPMRLMAESWTGTNLLGELAGNRFFMHEIPPYTPPTALPISYTQAPSGGARAELVQPRLWTRPSGGFLR